MLGSQSARIAAEFQSCRAARRARLSQDRRERAWSHKTGHGHSYARPLSESRKKAARLYVSRLVAAGRLTEADGRIYALGISASHHAATGLCFPSYDRIRDLARVRSRTTVSRGLTTLESVGLIRVTARRHETRTYETRGKKLTRGRPKTSNGFELVPVDELQAEAQAAAAPSVVCAASSALSAMVPEGASLPSHLVKWEAENGRPYPGRDKLLARLGAAPLGAP